MKRIFIIFCLFGLILNSFGQKEIEADYIEATTELTVRDSTLLEIIDANAPSGTARDAGSGTSLDGNSIDLGNSALNKNTEIPGAGYPLSWGTVGSRLGLFSIYSSGDLIYNSSANTIFTNGGISWTLDGSYWISAGGDTLATNAVVQELIAASEPTLPYNWQYTFNSNTTDSRPGIGLFRLNNATLASVTEIYIDYFDADGIAKNDFIAMPDTGSSVTVQTDVSNYALYKLTGGFVDNSNYFTYKVAYQSHNGVIAGLNTIDLDISNSTGSGGGAVGDSTSQTYTADTVFLTENGQKIYGQFSGTVLKMTTNEDGLSQTSLSLGAEGTQLTSDGGEIDITSSAGSVKIQSTSGGDASVFVDNGEVDILSNNNDIDIIATDRDVNITADRNINLTSGSNLYSVVDDSLFAEQENALFKNFFARLGGFFGNKAVLDTLIVAGDTATSIVDFADVSIDIAEVLYDSIVLNPIAPVSGHQEGNLHYESATKSLTFHNDQSNLSWQLGREYLVRFWNNTGSTITEGTLVRSVGAKVNGDITFEADLAGIRTLDSLQGIAMATVDVLDGDYGEATLIGQVNGLNTSAFNDNDLLWLGHGGTYQDSSPEAPDYSFIIGRVVYADADSGAIYMFPTGDVAYTPNPTFTASFEDSTETITNPGINIYELITSATNSLFEEKRNVGFTFQGDSISPNQDGNYTVFFSYSFQGTVAQTDIYKIGTFIDGAKGYATSRTASGNNNGGVPFTYSAFLTAGQWISFRVKNQSDAARNSVFTDGTVTINYSE